MSKHTPEPWQVGGPYPSVSIIVMIDPGCTHPDFAEPPFYEQLASLWICDTQDDVVPEEVTANAARIVACVNACQSLTNPAAELAQLREAVKLLGELGAAAISNEEENFYTNIRRALVKVDSNPIAAAAVRGEQ